MPKARSRLNILGRNWRVHFVKKARGMGADATGLTIYEKHLIQVLLWGPKERQRGAMLHELLHAVIDMTGGEHPADEEKCVASLESGLYQVLRHPDNRWMIDYLLEEDV